MVPTTVIKNLARVMVKIVKTTQIPNIPNTIYATLKLTLSDSFFNGLKS
jgi:hypothetical protein